MTTLGAPTVADETTRIKLVRVLLTNDDGIEAAGLQAIWLPDPTTDVLAYLILWFATATISIAAPCD